MSRTDCAKARYISLETFKRDGNGVKTPVWCAPLDDDIVVFSEARAFKVKRLRRDAKICVAPCDIRGKVLGEWCSGTGEIVESDAEQARAYDALHEKYGWQMWMADFFSTLSGRIKGRAVLKLTLDAD
ncbi:MAG: PPOX class F420-dependent oxidoreductase [Deltaproteobacteria bacterium]|nr:PPOX class F420-dependent oxidoreductase [Deltaproteobacteria bacterium]MBW2723233.1 PPOX class F420-dependent oxidoreductase [Deltaproteobacteria bacterium]